MTAILDPDTAFQTRQTIPGPTLTISATGNFTLFTGRRLRQRITRVELIVDATYAADPANYYVFTLTDALGQVAATWSTQTGQQGAITAGVPAFMALSATDTNRVYPPESVYQLRAVKNAAAANITVRPVVHLLNVGNVG